MQRPVFIVDYLVSSRLVFLWYLMVETVDQKVLEFWGSDILSLYRFIAKQTIRYALEVSSPESFKD
jgi:hypothetical protein